MIKATLAEQAYHYIIEQIKYGNLKEGTKVDESEIVEELGISRTPVREALLQLASDDVIVNIARKGFFVRSFGKKEKSDACTVLGHLDGLSATYAAPFLKEEDFAVLERMVDDMDEFIANQEFERYSNMQEEFHGYYQKLCPNHPLREVIDYVNKKYVLSTFYIDAPQLYKHLAIANDDHRKMVELMRENKKDELYKLISSHWGYKIYED